MSNNDNKKENEVVTEVQVAEEINQDQNVGEDVQVLPVAKDNNEDETKGHVNEELVKEDSDDDDYYVYEDEESRLLEEKKEAQQNEDKRLKEEERDTFWELFKLKMERDQNIALTNTEQMEIERVSVMGDLYRKMEYMEEEHLRYSKWIECRLVRSVIKKNKEKNSNVCVMMTTNENVSTQVLNIANS